MTIQPTDQKMDCGNCGNDALWFYFTEKGAPFYLCETCKGAFELGQVNAGADLFDIWDWEAQRENANNPEERLPV